MTMKRYREGCPKGVYYIIGTRAVTGEPEKIFYIQYRREGRTIEEKAGREFRDSMTPERAAMHRLLRMEGREKTNKERRLGRITFSLLWDKYEKTGKLDISDRNRYKNHLSKFWGSRVVANIRPIDIVKFRDRISNLVSPGTINNILELLRRVINFGVSEGIIEESPFSKAKNLFMPREETNVICLSREQMKTLLKAIEEDEHPQAGNIMKMALFTGMRRGELFRLQWDHVDYRNGFITLVDPKGGKDKKIPLNAAARSLLESIERTDSPYVFPGRGGGRRTDIARHVRRIRDAAGLPSDYRPLEVLRDTFAYLAVSRGATETHLCELLAVKEVVSVSKYFLAHRSAEEISNTLGSFFVTISAVD